MRFLFYLFLLVVADAQRVETLQTQTGASDCSVFADCSACVLGNCTWFDQDSICNSSRPALSDDFTVAKQFGFRNSTLCALLNKTAATTSSTVISTVSNGTNTNTTITNTTVTNSATNIPATAVIEEEENETLTSSLESEEEETAVTNTTNSGVIPVTVIEEENETLTSSLEEETATSSQTITASSIESSPEVEEAPLPTEGQTATVAPSSIEAAEEQASITEDTLRGVIAEQEAELDQANDTQASLENSIAELEAMLANNTLAESLEGSMEADLREAGTALSALQSGIAEEQAEVEQINSTLEEEQINMQAAENNASLTSEMEEQNQTVTSGLSTYLANSTIAQTIINASQRAMEAAIAGSRQANSTFQAAQAMAQNATAQLNAVKNRLSQIFGRLG